MNTIASDLFLDVQQLREKRCPVCGACVYPPGYSCIRCQRGKAYDAA